MVSASPPPPNTLQGKARRPLTHSFMVLLVGQLRDIGLYNMLATGAYTAAACLVVQYNLQRRDYPLSHIVHLGTDSKVCFMLGGCG